MPVTIKAVPQTASVAPPPAPKPVAIKAVPQEPSRFPVAHEITTDLGVGKIDETLQSVIDAVISPITEAVPRQQAAAKEGVKLMEHGAGLISEGDPAGALGVGLGALGYLGSPLAPVIQPVVDAVDPTIGWAFEEMFGTPRDITNMAIPALVPGMGVTRMPGMKAPPSLKSTPGQVKLPVGAEEKPLPQREAAKPVVQQEAPLDLNAAVDEIVAGLRKDQLDPEAAARLDVEEPSPTVKGITPHELREMNRMIEEARRDGYKGAFDESWPHVKQQKLLEEIRAQLPSGYTAIPDEPGYVYGSSEGMQMTRTIRVIAPDGSVVGVTYDRRPFLPGGWLRTLIDTGKRTNAHQRAVDAAVEAGGDVRDLRERYSAIGQERGEGWAANEQAASESPPSPPPAATNLPARISPPNTPAPPGGGKPPAPPRSPELGPFGELPSIADEVISGQKLLDPFRILTQDKFLRVKRVEQAIERARGNVIHDTPESTYRAEELYHGKVGEMLDRFKTERFDPLKRDIARAGVTPEQLNMYLLIRHAPERNAQIARINPKMPDGGSGVSTADARAAMQEINRLGLTSRLEPLAMRLDQLNAERLQILERGGLITPAAREAMQTTYRKYAPLKGFETVDDPFGQGATERARIGRGFDQRGGIVDRALGRKTMSGDIVAHTIAQYEEALVRAGKNEVSQRFLQMTLENPDPRLWTVDQAPIERYINPNTGLVSERIDPRFQLADNVMAVKVGGETHLITINDPVLARAMKNLGAEHMNGFFQALNSVTRVLARMFTQWNPAFTLPNFGKDLQTAAINTLGMGVPQISGAIVKDSWNAMRALWQVQRSKVKAGWQATDVVPYGGPTAAPGETLLTKQFPPKQLEWQRWAKEFAEDGGKINFFGLDDVETIARKMRNELKSLKPGVVGDVKRGFQDLFKLFEDLNGSVENATRLSIYKNLRELGVERSKAASVARNATVNFNRKGEWAPYLNSAYLFYNAGIQGSYQMLKSLTKSKKVQSVVAAGVLFGFIEDQLNANLLTETDPDGTSRWDKISDWSKDHNIILMTGGDELTAVKFPLPYGYNIFPALGRRISEIARGKQGATPFKAAIDTVADATDSFSPIGGGSTMFSGVEGFTRGVTPTVLQPFAEWAINMDYQGRPIQRPAESFGRTIPESQRGFGKEGPVASWVTRELNELTGGSIARSGAVDISPAGLDHVFEFYTGGVGKVVRQLFALPQLDGEEIYEPRNWPVLSRFLESKNQWWVNQRYYDLREAVMATAAEVKDAKIRRDRAAIKEIQENYGPEFRMIDAFNSAGRDLAELYSKRGIVQSSGRFTKEQAEERVEKINERVKALQLRLITKYQQLYNEDQARRVRRMQ